MTIDGEVFIVTEGAANYRMGLITIEAIPEESAGPYIKQAFEEREKARQSRLISTSKEGDFDPYRKIDRELNESLEDANFMPTLFAGLPPAVAISKTDSDGKFEMKLPHPGKYRIVARGERKVPLKKTEKYYWLVEVDTNRNGQKLMLSNDNLIN